MDYELGLITSTRTKHSFENTLNSLKQAGFNKIINVFIDSVDKSNSLDSLSSDSKIRLHVSEKKLGMVENTRFAWQFLYEKSTAPWIMVCEDDILCKSCMFQVLEDTINSIQRQIGYISCYTPLIYSQMADYTFNTFGWKKINMGMHTWGTQFFAMQRSTCELVLSKWSKFYTIEKLQDRIIGEILQDSRLDCFYPYPSLVNHIGLSNSTHMKSPLIGNTAWLYGFNIHELVLRNYEVFL